ncbi:MAG: IPTL-CTERM sorting domain-containing protein, partial [Thermodesulfobacteriota bacterium]
AQYLPVGPQVNVPQSTVTNGGWVECYRDTYDNFMNADEVLANCPGDRLMLACKPVGSQTLMLLAQGERSDVTFNTGNDNNDVTHIANGVGWYFNNDGIMGEEEGDAWGFVRAGDSVAKNNCDVDSSGANNERLCWHLQEDVGGYRCGSIGNDEGDLNEGPEAMAYERIVYMPGSIAPTEVPTLSQWGLIAMAGVLGVVGFMVMRRKRATA